MALNEAQAHSLATALRILEERCDQIEALLAPATAGSLNRVIADIPPEAEAPIRAQLAALRRAIAELAETYDLQAAPRSALQLARSLIVTGWETLDAVRPAQLARYGPVDAAIVRPLDRALMPMLERLDILRRLLAQPMDL